MAIFHSVCAGAVEAQGAQDQKGARGRPGEGGTKGREDGVPGAEGRHEVCRFLVLCDSVLTMPACSWKEFLLRALCRPFVLFAQEPIIQLFGVYLAFVYGTVYRKYSCRL